MAWDVTALEGRGRPLMRSSVPAGTCASRGQRPSKARAVAHDVLSVADLAIAPLAHPLPAYGHASSLCLPRNAVVSLQDVAFWCYAIQFYCDCCAEE